MTQFRKAILNHYLLRIRQAKYNGHDFISVKVEDMGLLLYRVDEQDSCRKEIFRKFKQEVSQRSSQRISTMAAVVDELEIILLDVERSWGK